MDSVLVLVIASGGVHRVLLGLFNSGLGVLDTWSRHGSTVCQLERLSNEVDVSWIGLMLQSLGRHPDTSIQDPDLVISRNSDAQSPSNLEFKIAPRTRNAPKFKREHIVDAALHGTTGLWLAPLMSPAPSWAV